MNAKPNRIVTYRDRARIQSAIGLLPVLFFMVAGIYFGVTEGDWLILVFATLAAAGLVLFFVSNERTHRDNP